MRNVENAIALWAGCGRLLLQPDADTRAGVASGAIVAGLVAAAREVRDSEAGTPLESVAERVASAADALASAPSADGLCDTARPGLDEAFVRTFGHALSPDYPPYETQYGDDPVFRQPQRLADVRGFYEAFGVQVPADAHERADHLGVEMEFVALLTAREATADAAGEGEHAAICTDALAAFVRDHVGPVLPTFRRMLAERAPGRFFPALALLAEATCAWDCARRGIAVAVDDRARLVRVLEPDPEEVEA